MSAGERLPLSSSTNIVSWMNKRREPMQSTQRKLSKTESACELLLQDIQPEPFSVSQSFDWTVESIVQNYKTELLRVIHTHHLYALRRQRPGTTRAEALSLSKALKTFKYYGIVLNKILKKRNVQIRNTRIPKCQE